jgi:hypothetical protein
MFNCAEKIKAPLQAEWVSTNQYWSYISTGTLIVSLQALNHCMLIFLARTRFVFIA